MSPTLSETRKTAFLALRPRYTMCTYGNCSKISNTKCLPKGLKAQSIPRSDCFLKKQSDQGFLKKQSDQGLLHQAICEFQSRLSSFHLRTEKEVFEIEEHLLYISSHRPVNRFVIWKVTVNLIEPWLEIFNNLVCVTSKGSDQPVHTRSLIRAFASRLNIL